MKRYHSIKSSRKRTSRKKLAREYLQIKPEELEKSNLDREMRWLGSCGVKHCQLCSWTRYYSKTKHKLSHTDNTHRIAATQQLEDLYSGHCHTLGDWDDDQNMYRDWNLWDEDYGSCTDEDLQWTRAYLNKQAA